MILSGEVKLDKRELEKLSSKSKDEIETITVNIEEGTYAKKTPSQSPATPPPSPIYSPVKPSSSEIEDGNTADTQSGKTQRLDAIVSNLVEEFSSVFNQNSENCDATVSKAALRTLIDKLENLYQEYFP